MASLWVTVLVLSLALVSKATPFSSTESIQETLGVFQKGNLETTNTWVRSSPEPLLIVSPITTGKYPVLFFIHGTWLENYFYSDIFEHIASHGFIVVAPQLCWLLSIPSGDIEVEMAASVINWLPSNLDSLLPGAVEGDLTKLALSGHSRGGKAAFALALGKSTTKLNLNISALIGVDPVEGSSKQDRPLPHVLTYVPNSFNLSIPITVIGTGLGNHSKFLFPRIACAPNHVNHVEYFNECKNCTHFVIKDFGHMDMLDTNALLTIQGSMTTVMCVSGRGAKGPMRRSISGIMVAFLNAYFRDEALEYGMILINPSLAPAKLYPVQFKLELNSLASTT